ncbi:MotA/TolQ/ExbB proton channel [Desulfonatronospira thiodismutans ASO3-1]|uniref:MotA/TolQ/ExbB proton channel n=1 Tax=Desulfonatronospira thiodismutans ASO3-1 TaxID=555779 RepID=D6SL68_9BACT|nr:MULTISPECIES: MotA/TolQ/ExbB proton channel family protein [Desulfonatronospira]EFI35429.1 MotA/TolQ/ExbB proton channel [Desulfonatronospira thiodismutans ASO3-1]RQD78037.1 MAG: MotA/TolQ/ExbB proton channel family protein [Desulfonatronospira sp. MSAO_Bac3]
MYDYFVSGGPVMYPLLACSIIALTVTIERVIFWTLVHVRRDPALVDEVLDLYRLEDWESIKQKVSGSRDFVIRVLVSGILHRDFSMGKAMESAAGEEIKRMQRFNGVLDTMITVAPLLGILGTVIGIIHSFDILGQTGGIEEPREVTAGIAQALITTATGLVIAILALFPFKFFSSRVEDAAAIMERYATSLEIVHEKQQQGAARQEQV